MLVVGKLLASAQLALFIGPNNTFFYNGPRGM